MYSTILICHCDYLRTQRTAYILCYIYIRKYFKYSLGMLIVKNGIILRLYSEIILYSKRSARKKTNTASVDNTALIWSQIPFRYRKSYETEALNLA